MLLTILLTVVLLFAVTTAWYSNVIQTGGLTFEAAAWGFTGEVILEEGPVQAAPGESGAVGIEISNQSDMLIEAGVTVSKSEMPLSMQKRFYFYADTQAEKNGEQMERVYLDRNAAYQYTLLPQSRLVLKNEDYNDTLLKWEWVYDVLGYYVRATVTNDEAPVVIEEYMRPVVYDYDAATFDEKGNLLTVDGEMTATQFLAELSRHDGYAGEIDAQHIVRGYYPVDVDETGYGVWAYLCTRGEIEYETVEDTKLGQDVLQGSAEETQQFTATLNITGQQKNFSVKEVRTSAELEAALLQNTGDMVQLNADIAVINDIVITGGQQMFLNLNGHVLHTATKDAAFSVQPGGALTVLDGVVTGNGNGYAFQVQGGTLALSGVDVQDVGYAVFIEDSESGGKDSQVRIIGCELVSDQSTILIRGNGAASAASTQLVVEKSKVISRNYVGIIGDGAVTGSGAWGTDIQVRNSTINGLWAGIYQPQQQSRLVVNNSRVTGYTGIAVKGGNVVITDSSIEGTGEGREGAFEKGGWTDTGDGVYVETNYSWPIDLLISGTSNVRSIHQSALRQFASDAPHAKIKVTGGTFSSDVTAFLPEGGGYSCTQGTDGMYQVTGS